MMELPAQVVFHHGLLVERSYLLVFFVSVACCCILWVVDNNVYLYCSDSHIDV